MLEISLDTMAVDAESPDDESIKAGAPPLVVVHVVGGSSLPLADPQNPGRPIRFPSTTVHFPLSKDAALKLAELLTEHANAMPDANTASSKLITASNMGEVAQVAEVQKRLK